MAKQMQAEEQEELSIEEKSKLFVQLLEARKKHFAAKRAEEKRNMPPTRAQQRSIMCTYLKNMAGWKPKDLKNKSFANIQELFDKAMKRVNTFVDMDTKLVEGSEVRAEGSETREESSSKRAGDELEQEKAKKQKVDEDKETAELQSLMKVIPDEEEVAVDAIPLATKPPSIVDWKILKEGKISYYQIIRADGSSKRYSAFIQMLKSFDREDLETLWKLVKAKHGSTRPEEGYERGRIVGIKRLLDDLRVTAAKVLFGEGLCEEEVMLGGPLVWPTITVDGVTKPKEYTELTPSETIQADCDIKAINIILQGLPTKIYALVSQHRVAKDIWEKIKLLMHGTSLTKQEREYKLYDEFDKFTYKKGESLHEYYLRFTLLLNDMNIYKMPLEQFQVNTKFLNTLPAEWSKFVTDVKLVKDLNTTNVDQIHAHLEQHEQHANEVRLMHERNSDHLALVASHQMT
ncbi:hypothetical protein Tco_0979879 [Tanacetum coccineum]